METKEATINFKNISDADFTVNFEKWVRNERKSTHIVLLHIIECEKRELYKKYGYDKMFSYLTKHFKYSEPSAYARLQSAQVLKKIPEVVEQLEEGSVNLTQLVHLQRGLKNKAHKGQIITKEQTKEILEKIENKTGFETQKLLAVEFNEPIKEHEVVRPQRDESVRLEMTFTKEEFEEIQLAKSLISHQCVTGTWSEVMTLLARKINKAKLGKAVIQSMTDNKKTDVVKPTDDTIEESQSSPKQQEVDLKINIPKTNNSSETSTQSFADTIKQSNKGKTSSLDLIYL